MHPYLLKTKRLFRRRTVREQLLALIFILVLLFIWTGSVLKEVKAWDSNRRQAQSDLVVQQQWLDRAEDYASRLEQALERVDPKKTFEGAQLSEKIDAILRQAGLSISADIDPVQTREGEIFNDHTIRVRLKRISIAKLIQLNELLRKETPYINIQSIRITKNKNKPEELDIRFKINSFDLIQDS
jgi:type II secretory pathway component PulM